MAYQIMISEGQRQLLLRLLEANPEVIAAHIAHYASTEAEHHNLMHLQACMASLPVHEAEEAGTPIMLHGFCL